MSEYTPMEGDRVIVTGGKMLPGGRMGTVGLAENGIEWWVRFDKGNQRRLRSDMTVELRHRPTPPRPVVKPFVRSDSNRVDWLDTNCRPFITRALTADDARAYARMYAQVAEQMEWDAKYGGGE